MMWCDSINFMISSSVNSHYHPSLRGACSATEVKTAAVDSTFSAESHHLVSAVQRCYITASSSSPGGCSELCLLPCSDSCFRAPYVDSDSAPRGEGPCTPLKDTSLHQGHSQQKQSSFFFFFGWSDGRQNEKINCNMGVQFRLSNFFKSSN